jgi:hypothetical protein
MPVYIICSTDKEDLGYIHGLNLCPYFPTTSATIQVQSINTQANFQILTEADHIDFEISNDATPNFRLSLGDQQGLSYDSLPALINTHIVRAGEVFTAMFDTLHKLVFIHKKKFWITGMTYNYEVLLGYTGATFPIVSHPKTMWVSKRSAEISDEPINNAQWVFPPGGSQDLGFMSFKSVHRFVYSVLPVKIVPEGNYNYKIIWEADFNLGDPQFLDIIPETGTLVIYKDKESDFNTVKQCTVRAKIYSGKTENPFMTLETRFMALHRYTATSGTGNTEPPVYLIGKTTLLFGEATRLAAVPYATAGYISGLTEIQTSFWLIDNTEILTFYGQVGDRVDDHTISCTIQAGYKAGTTRVTLRSWQWWKYNPQTTIGDWVQSQTPISIDITVVNDQAPVIRQEIEPPMVGTGLSTNVLYLLSNCGSHSYRNSLEDGERLQPAQVSAIIPNAFSPSFPVQSSSDIIAKIPTPSLSNLWFRLVDANFVPIKLLNPLYLTLSVNPVDPAAGDSEDITPFLGRLPRDLPTPEQKKKAEEEAAAQKAAAEEQKQTSGIIQEVISGLVQQYKTQRAQEQEQGALQEQEAQNQLLNDGYTPEQIQQAFIQIQPPPPPPTQEEIQASQEAETQAEAETERAETQAERQQVLETVQEPIS